MIDFNVLPDGIFILLWGFSLVAVGYWQNRRLRAIQQRIPGIPEGFPDLITLARADTAVLECNEAYQKLLGDWRGKRWIDLVPASEQAYVREKLAQLTPEQPTVRCVNSLPDAKGQVRWFEWINQGLFDQSGQLQFIRAIGRDITERKQLEESLRLREAQLRTLLDALPVGVWARDPQGILILQNATDRAWFGDLLGTPIPEENTQWKENLARAFAVCQQGRALEYEGKYEGWETILGEERYTYRLIVPIQDQSEGLGVLGIVLDMTEQKRLEQELQEKEKQLRALVENSHDIFHRVDAEGRLQRLNPKAVQAILGYIPTPGDAQPLERVHPQDRDQVAAAFDQLLARPGQPLSFVYRMQHADGHWVWLESLATNWLADPEIRAIVANTRDVSHLYQAAEQERLLGRLIQQIRQTLDLEQILQTTVEAVRQCLQVDRVMIYRLEAPLGEGVIVAESVAEPWPSQLGRFLFDRHVTKDSCHRKCQQGFIQALSDVATADLDPCYRQLLESFQAQANLVVPIQNDSLWGLLAAQHCQGPRLWQEWEIKLLQQLTEHLAIAVQQVQLYVQVQSLNQTLEAKVQERTAQLERSLQFESLLKRISERVRDSLDEGEILGNAVRELGENLPVDICEVALYNSDYTVSTIVYEYCPQATSALGASVPMVGGDYDEIYQQLLQGQACLFCFVTPDRSRPNQKEHRVIFAVPLTDRGHILGDLWVFRSAATCSSAATCFDEQELQLIQQVASQCAIALRQARLYQAAQEQVLALERLNQLKDHFISTVSHELRTPLTSLKMALQMLQVTPPGEKQAQYLAIAQRECSREIELINDLLDLQRLEAKAYAPNWRTLTWAELIGDLLTTTRERAQSRGQNFQADVPFQRSLTTDPTLLGRILREFLHNAVKYTPQQGSIHLKVKPDPEWIWVEVSNSQEIPSQELPRIFDRFYRIPSSNPWKEAGTGLGLALVKEIVDRLQGSLQVTSQNGWTTFSVRIPQVAQVEAAPDRQDGKSALQSSSLSCRKS